jgi:hypothetical protein
METKPTNPASVSNPAKETPTPSSNGVSSTPAKKFARAIPPAPKRGPGRPPKPDSSSRGNTKPFGSVSADGNSATVAAPGHASTAAVEISAPAAVRGLLKAVSPLAGMVTAMATKIDLMTAMQIWQFSERELKEIETPGGAFLEKYAPSIDSFGVEIEFAGALFTVMFPKMLAIVAAKKLLEKSAGAARPVAPAAAAPPRPAPAAAAAPPAPAAVHHDPPPAAIDVEPPNPFAAELNAGMARAAGGMSL